MGRETFLARVIWENGWPVIAPGVGHLEDEFTIDMPEHRFAEEITNSDVIHFWGEQLDQRLVAIEDWTSGIYSLTEREGALRMYLRKEKISERANCAYLGVRQKSYRFVAETGMEFYPEMSRRRRDLCFTRIMKIISGLKWCAWMEKFVLWLPAVFTEMSRRWQQHGWRRKEN